MSRILVVEDEPANVEILKRLLTRKKHDVLVANTKEEAVATAAAEQPDLILMDISLPGIDGVEATSRLKARPDTGPIPIIALTANAMRGDRERFLAAGCDDYLSKPISTAELLEKLHRHLHDGQG